MAYTYQESAALARQQMGPCKACPVCDGRACKGKMPGPGAKGSGMVALENVDAWTDLHVVMNTFHEIFAADTHTTLLKSARTPLELALPVMIAPVGDVERHYGTKLSMQEYNSLVLEAAAASGTLAWTGDGLNPEIMSSSCTRIHELGGRGIPTIKPWSGAVLDKKIACALASGAPAIAMDVDAAGLPFLRGQEPPAGAKSFDELAAITRQIHEAGLPFIIKGVMHAPSAARLAALGVDGIVVSNHGGRVLDGVPATAAVLEACVRAFKAERPDATVLVDGGIRSGLDVFKARALGADATLIARPMVVAAYGAGVEGVKGYLAQLQSELADTMELCGAATLADITPEMLAR